MVKSEVEKMLLSKDFNEIIFFETPYSLRCELGIGYGDEYFKTAYNRALEIYDIVIKKPVDAIVFDYFISDYTKSGEADDSYEWDIDNCVEQEADILRFVLECQRNYRHAVVKGLDTFDDMPEEEVRILLRNRVICYMDGKEYDYKSTVNKLINGGALLNISFVSFENECVYSIYDDRGCDIAFATKQKMVEFYPKLEQYFLQCNVEEMYNRFKG